ncbi:MAG TPA: sulfurtransferase TusA family protein [Candidatus Methanoperedenaceae archaeon]|nr:sulfurtransferase TusA family protein [Candidatus Methanoperedenaceae archaeon]
MIERVIDVGEKVCPYPLLVVKKEVSEMEEGETVRIRIKDPLSFDNVVSWARSQSNQILEETEKGGVYEVLIRKSENKKVVR